MIHELISGRKSIRSFEDRSIDNDTLNVLFEAARWAPSSRNEQPWRFLVAKRGSNSFNTMASTLTESNKTWAQKSSALVLVLSKIRFTDPDVPNSHSLFDTGLAVANFSFQAQAYGISLHQMGGFHPAAVREKFGVPEGFEPVVIIALGYKGSPDALPDHLRARETMHRSRKPLSELVFADHFGTAAVLDSTETGT
jgi:nitroreductase